MSELSKEKLIGILRSAGRLPGLKGWHGETVEQIVALIKKSEVTEEWIEEWDNRLKHMSWVNERKMERKHRYTKKRREFLRQMLEDAGVCVT